MSRRAALRNLATSAAALFGALIVVDGDTVKLDGRSYRLLGFEVMYQQQAPNPYATVRRGAIDLHLLAVPDQVR